jgi:hypothetical protein
MPYLGYINRCRVDPLTSTEEQLDLNQNLIKLNKNELGQGVLEKIAGFIIERGQLPDAILQFDEETQSWEFGLENNLKPLDKVVNVIEHSSVLSNYTVNYVDTQIENITLILPESPTTNATITIIDLYGNSSLHPIRITSMHNIMGNSEDLFLDVPYSNSTLTYVNDTIGWSLSPSNPLMYTNIHLEEYPPDDINLDDIKIRSLNIVSMNTDFIASPGNVYYVDTSNNNIDIMLPYNPTHGNWFDVIDDKDTFDLNSVYIRTHHNYTVNYEHNDLELDTKSLSLRFLYRNGDWNIFVNNLKL